MKLLRPGFIHLQLLGELRIIKNPFGRGRSQASVRQLHLLEVERDAYADSL